MRKVLYLFFEVERSYDIAWDDIDFGRVHYW